DAKPDAIVIGAYDPGKIPDFLYPDIGRATRSGIPVFSIYQTFVDQNVIDITNGINHPHIFQPEALYNGLIPLQLYPKRILELGEKQKALLEEYPEFEPIERFCVKMNGTEIVCDLLKGIGEICRETDDYREKVSRVRERFSSPEFNRLVNVEMERAMLIYNS
ncbi:MAG: hypothetical protein V1870_05575, partial [Candidatus Aenigmatarchaeota archaeon]